MVINAAGELYVKDYEDAQGNNVYKVDASTGVATLYQSRIANAGERAVGLTFGPDGKLITSSEYNGSNQKNSVIAKTQDGQTTVLIPDSAGYLMYGGDIKLLPDGFLYWTITNSTSKLCRTANAGGSQAIMRIDPNTKATKEIACLDTKDVFGLGFALKSLYGFSNSGTLIKINLATGKVTLVKETGLSFIGAAANPILW
jgi:DNA-binding beta-propeller fold protein YncE